MAQRAVTITTGFLAVMLAVELLDELVYGANEAAWPLIRDDLALSYVQIGILLSVPRIVASLIEPVFGILADTWKRRVIILGGGAVFALSLGMVSQSTGFLILLLAYSVLGSASGAFVSISQAALMDADERRHEQNMARWTFAGSAGVVAGPLALGAITLLGYGWRDLFLVFALVTIVILVWVWQYPLNRLPTPDPVPGEKAPGFRRGFSLALQAVRRKEVLRWLTLLEFSDLMLDVLLGFLALYFVDVAGFTPAQASLGVAVWTGMGLLGDFLLIPLLERLPGMVYLRASTVIELFLFTGFLLVEPAGIKLVLVGLLGFFNSGWYAILRARLYSAMPGMSGASVAVSNLGGLIGSVLPLSLGWLAQVYGLQASMWLLLLGPVALWIGLPRHQREDPPARVSEG